ncbi:RNA-binding S4 domain-containing protein [Gemella sp. GH3]|uniref:RNA-binding S4 domain-containing protein n=1 Tax=unclassified Gemella TaxID=2624949 RepID=UPI0015D028C1|nr:RNA-binding S4 domain-containing protein [Gemella sp. GH3.1]NYS50896.1 RNA-binding S4 domain-containing protein [Gemella sp. GH3]
MRIDKFLKVSRIIKRRTIANEICQKGYISVNGRTAKASTALNVGDRVTIFFAKKEVEYEVLELKDSSKKEDASKMFRVISEKVKEF